MNRPVTGVKAAESVQLLTALCRSSHSPLYHLIVGAIVENNKDANVHTSLE